MASPAAAAASAGEAPAHHRPPFPAVQRVVDQLLERDRPFRLPLGIHLPGAEHEPGRLAVEAGRSHFHELGPGVFRRCLHRITRGEGAPLGKGPHIKGRDIGIAGDDGDVRRLDAQHLGSDDRHRGVGALPHVGNTGQQRHRAILGNLQEGGGRVVLVHPLVVLQRAGGSQRQQCKDNRSSLE